MELQLAIDVGKFKLGFHPM